MAGLTDVPFRTQAWRYGAGYMVSEMVASKPELWETGKSRLRRVPVEGVTPVAVQIAGTDPQVMADAARRHVDDGVDVIDINFGCPAKKVCRKLAGSALLADLPLVSEIVETVVSAVNIPVTVKTRTGLVPGDALGLEFARRAEDAGAAMLVMHARSRQCRFVGAVDYQAVAKVVKQTSIPVLVNGDIDSPTTAARALKITGAAGVMVGRAAIGQPWLFAELSGQTLPSLGERWQTILDHVRHMHEFYGDFGGVRIARKHVQAYLERMDIEDKPFLHLSRTDEQIGWLEECRDMQLEQHFNYLKGKAWSERRLSAR